ncbi:MAG TPA: DEAD/DEAH box helicase, partial [Treponemataceae bacterium]|nr:DEAD/DEAH box helicase [Treponemataceae bacterium]
LSVFSVDFSAWRYRFLLKEKKARVAVATQEALEFSLSMSVLVNDKAVPLKDAVEKTGDLGVLKAPTALSGYLGEIRTLSQKASVTLSSDRLVSFLDEAAILLSRLGVEIILPKSLHKELKPRLVLRGEAKKSTASLTSYLGLGTLLNYEWSIAIGDTLLSPAEFEKLVKGNKALVSFRDGYVRLDPKETAALLKNAQGSKKLGALDVLKTWFIGDTLFSSDAECMVSNLVGEKDFSVPATLSATLRPYQERGFRWVCSLLSSGFGCILADDMGLGKTIQAITVLLSLKEQGLIPGGTLVIAPAALLANWEKEIERFAPSLCVRLFHGTGRSLTSKADVYLTTYQTAVRAAESLNEKRFSLLIADEAHLMKNAQTRAARTVKSLIVPFRLALSGTPVENRLEDLRSLFDFVIPGYLGTPEAFKKEFRVPIEVDRRKDVATRLRDLTAPFLLRRLKTDKTIITDLPEKITINEYSALSKEQAALYESLVQKGMEESQKAVEPKDRSALILKLLTSLKQVCDHPRVYDKESPPISELSGKCGLLMTLLEEILRNREKVLIFSQYVESLKTLESMIASELGEKPILYYGGMNQTKRNEAVHSFQNDSETRIMLVSLKAGGLGLNLTAASRVIHFDLWYNPAVEQQATDRAFRIGQAKNVFVHRFVTRGTFEEKIDAMLTSRQELADMTVSSGETWLARMSHEELQALFSAVKG